MVEFLDPNSVPAVEGVVSLITKRIAESASDEQAQATAFKKENVNWHRGRALAWQYFLNKYHVNIDTCTNDQREKLRDKIAKKIAHDIDHSDPMEPNTTIDKLNRKYRDMINARILCFNLSPEGDIEFEITL